MSPRSRQTLKDEPHTAKTTGCLRALQSELRGSPRSHSDVSDAAAASDLRITSARRGGARCKCTTKKHASRFHTSQSSAEPRPLCGKISLLKNAQSVLRLFMGSTAATERPGPPPWVSDGPQERRIISEIAEGALCCCVQSMANQEAGRQAGRQPSISNTWRPGGVHDFRTGVSNSNTLWG